MAQDEDYKSEKSKRRPAPSRSSSNRHSFPKSKSSGASKVSKKQAPKEKSKKQTPKEKTTLRAARGWVYVDEPIVKNVFLEAEVIGKRRSSQTGRGRESMGTISVPKMSHAVKKGNFTEIEEIEAGKIVAAKEVAIFDQPRNPLTDPEAPVTIADLEEMASANAEKPISKVLEHPAIDKLNQNPARANEAADQSAIYGNLFFILFNLIGTFSFLKMRHQKKASLE